MTDKPTPTDAELNTILCAHWPAFAMQSTFVKIWVRDALQDAIDKWGQPAHAAEPVAWAFKYDDGTWHDPSTTEHSPGMRPLCAAPQPVAREPLTDEQTKALMQAHRTAMLMTCKARVPECGEFAAIAQDLDWLCESFGITGGQHVS